MKKSHAFVNASIPICMALFIMPIHEWAVFIEREKELLSKELEKADAEKRPSESNTNNFFYQELENLRIVIKKMKNN